MPVLMSICTEKSRQLRLLKIQSCSVRRPWSESAEQGEYRQILLKKKIVSTVEQLGVLPEYLQTQARIWQDMQH